MNVGRTSCVARRQDTSRESSSCHLKPKHGLAFNSRLQNFMEAAAEDQNLSLVFVIKSGSPLIP
jgi:hypothetical protein